MSLADGSRAVPPRQRSDPGEAALSGPIAAAERAVLAAMMLAPDAVVTARALVGPSDFFRTAHGKLFEAICALTDRGARADSVTVGEELRRRGDLDAVGLPTIASILEYSTGPANLDEHARIVVEASRKRRLRRLGLDLTAAAEDPAVSSADLLARLDEGRSAVRPEVAGGRFALAAVAAPELVAREIERPRSLLGAGVLAAGGFAILYGQPGLGKSWLALLLARSAARGEPWLGLATPPDGARVGVLQLELGVHTVQARLRALGVGRHERDEGLRVVCRPELKGPVDLLVAAHVADLRSWIERGRLNLLVLDALSRAHTADENDAKAMGAVLAMLDGLRHETGCTLVVVHHEGKPRDGRDPDDDLSALRGSSRLQSDPTLHLRVVARRGLRCLRFARVSEAAEPAPVWFVVGEDGTPVVVPSPESVRDANRERVMRVVVDAGGPVRRAEVEAATGLGRSAVAGHLKALVDEGALAVVGENRDAAYSALTVRPSEPSTEQAVDGLFPMGDNALTDSGVEPSASGRDPTVHPPPSTPKGVGRVDGRSGPDGPPPDGGGWS